MRSLAINIKNCFTCVIIGLMLLLNACSTVKKDGPPNYYVDETKIPDAVPKVEAMSKYGNMPNYRVFGRRYHVMTSSKNYEEKGLASWYGTAFHAQRTSSGERYNMLAMTAAHKTLPLPTYVQVTNLKNGRKIIVKVNDRGPFESNRLIDLSYVAAKKLGMLGHGTAMVDVKAIDPLHYDKNSAPAKTPTNAFHNPEVIIAENSVSEQPVAQNVAPVETASLAAKPVITSHRNKHSHRVASAKKSTHSLVYLQMGSFKNKLAAEQFKKKLTPLISSPVKITRLAKLKNSYQVQIGPMKNTTLQHVTKRLKAAGISNKQRLQYQTEV